MGCLIFPFFFPSRSRPLIGGAGIAGKVRQFPFRDISGIAGKQSSFFTGMKVVIDATCNRMNTDCEIGKEMQNG